MDHEESRENRPPADEQAARHQAESTPQEAAEAASSTEQNPAGQDEQQQLREQLAQAQDRNLRLQAELENLRRRSQRDLQERTKYAALPLMRDLLPVMDNISRAIEAAEKDPDAGSLLEGVKLMAQQLSSALRQHQCEPIQALHQQFDPNLHEALMQQPTTEHPPGTVVVVTQTGYRLHDRVIRPAQVIVASSPAEPEAAASGD